MENRFMLNRQLHRLSRQVVPTRRVISGILIATTLAVCFPAASANEVNPGFRVKSSLASIELGCNGTTPAPYNDIAPAEVQRNGHHSVTTNDGSGSACPTLLAPSGQQIYAYQSITDVVAANNSPPDPIYGSATSSASEVSFLGGVLSYAVKKEAVFNCTETPSHTYCTGTAHFNYLEFEGRRIDGSYEQKQVIPSSGLRLQLLNSTCNGLAVFNGSLTLNDVVVSPDHRTIAFYPLSLDGTLTCVGLPLSTIEVHIKDVAQFEALDEGLEGFVLGNTEVISSDL